MPNSRVEVYYNLHRSCLSYRRPGGRVSHAECVVLRDVTFAVQPAGLVKARREQRRNVHAFVRGTPSHLTPLGSTAPAPYTADLLDATGARRVTYNPFRADTFTYADSGEAALAAPSVIVLADKTMWVPPRHRPWPAHVR